LCARLGDKLETFSVVRIWNLNRGESGVLSDARMNLGNAYRGKLELAKAKEQYEKVVALDPTLADTYYNLAILHLDSDVPGMDTIDRYNKAIAYFTTYKEKGGADDRVEQYLKDAAKGIDREQRRREREKKDQLRKAEKEAADAKKQAEAAAQADAAAQAPAAAPTGGDAAKAAQAPASDTSGTPPAQTSKKKTSRSKVKTP